MFPQRFELITDMKPMGDQPQAIERLVAGLREGKKYQTLLGVTGSGKTFTMANVIAQINRPTLVISHNKTLAAQLYEEFKELFPRNAVHYFVSYYDYYQPEAYIPQRDIYIEKDASRNDNLDRLRLAATSALISRRDVIIVASVSCIFGLGSPESYQKSVVSLATGQTLDRRDLLAALADLQYNRAQLEFKRGTYRVLGDVVEVFQAGEEVAHRIEFFGDQIESLATIDPLTGQIIRQETHLFIYPAVHYVVPPHRMHDALRSIEEELEHRVRQLKNEGKLLEAQRLLARTRYDLELIREFGVCPGIENYARHLDGRPPGAKPYTLLDYFDLCASTHGLRSDGDPGWLLFIDESHVTIPQLRAMYHGDRNRKETLVEHGFRLPSALDNRPLRFEEIEKLWPQVIFVSATPGPYELEKCDGQVVEQIIRPTGLVDPIVEVRPAANQVEDVFRAAQERAKAGERTLINTLTKRLAEHLAAYLAERGLRCRYIHSEIQTLDRVEILRALREGEYDVLVGVNLLREGLDLPEVSLVAILDADKTGFLRSPTSLIQQIGRAARNINATVLLYADTITPAMRQAIDETNRRREKQLAFNREHGITPQTIRKAIRRGIELELRAYRTVSRAIGLPEEELDRTELLAELEKAMLEAAQNLEFEKAAAIRDRIRQLKNAPADTVFSTSDLSTTRPAPGTPGLPARQRRRPRPRRF